MYEEFRSQVVSGHDDDGLQASHHSGLFVSLLLRYPQIGSVRYLPETGCLVIGFTIQQELTQQAFEHLKGQLQLSLEVYSELSGRPIHVLDVAYTNFPPFCSIEVTRDVDTLTQLELSVIVGVIADRYEQTLVYEPLFDDSDDDELRAQDDLIEHMLDDVRLVRPPRNLIGFRDHGRVVVRFGERKH